MSLRDKFYVKAGETDFFDARGKRTGMPIFTRRAASRITKKTKKTVQKQIDRDFARMLNHAMSVEYQIDEDYFDFMERLLRFRDPRGNTAKYDNLNEFRHLINSRGEQGYGLMATAKWHRMRGKPFSAMARIDGRGRVYYNGYLNPTGGEVVRPFLNSSVDIPVTPEMLRELKIQTGAMLASGTEGLSNAGRIATFDRFEKQLREVGELMMAKTQPDRRLREYLEHPLIRKFEGEEIPKISRLALEYTRWHNHTGGKFDRQHIHSSSL